MKEQPEEKVPRLSVGQWLSIMSALGAGLVLAASKMGFSFQSTAADPVVSQIRSDLAKEIEMNTKQADQMTKDEQKILELDYRIRELEHQQGYDGSGQNPWYSKKRP